MMRALIIALIFLAVSSPALAGDRDGNWWISLPKDTQLSWAIGFLDGVRATEDEAYGNLGVWVLSGDLPCKDTACINKMKQNIEELLKRYDNITVEQISDGLTMLYSDYRNRNINVADMQEIVIEYIQGSTDTQIQKRLEFLRKNSSK